MKMNRRISSEDAAGVSQDMKAQGPYAIQRAACDAVAAYLDRIAESSVIEDLWEDHPLLLHREVDRAASMAGLIAHQLRDFVRLMAPLSAEDVRRYELSQLAPTRRNHA